MDEELEQAVTHVADVNAIAIGLSMSLKSMRSDLCEDSRYYALEACIDAIVERSANAADALDMYKISRFSKEG